MGVPYILPLLRINIYHVNCHFKQMVFVIFVDFKKWHLSFVTLGNSICLLLITNDHVDCRFEEMAISLCQFKHRAP